MLSILTTNSLADGFITLNLRIMNLVTVNIVDGEETIEVDDYVGSSSTKQSNPVKPSYP